MIVVMVIVVILEVADGSKKETHAISHPYLAIHHLAECFPRIDSIADMAAFGIAPAVIAVHLGLTSPFGVMGLIFYVCCGAMRLAFFNVHGIAQDGKRRFYTGLPVTYSALVFPMLLLFATSPAEPPLLWLIHANFWVLGALFVLRVPVPKPGGIFYVIFPLVAVVLTIFWGLRL